jgi:hypothetical protein
VWRHLEQFQDQAFFPMSLRLQLALLLLVVVAVVAITQHQLVVQVEACWLAKVLAMIVALVIARVMEDRKRTATNWVLVDLQLRHMPAAVAAVIGVAGHRVSLHN